MALQPVTRRSVPEEVFEQIATDVLTGEMPPGEALPSERRLAELLGVSRPAVREALKRLSAAGLVEVRQGDVTTVRDFRRHAGLDLLPRLLFRNGELDISVVRSILEARLRNFPKVAELAAERNEPELAELLQDSLRALDTEEDPIVWLTKSDHDLADTVERIDDVLGTVRKFVSDNRSVLAADVNNLADATTTLVQPEPRDGLETALHVLPTYASNFNNLYYPLHSSLVGQFVFPNFANPIQLICSAIQAGSRLGYQESAELCAQYLAPVLDALKFNYLPFGSNPFSSAATLPKEVAYSEERLRPPPGYKDTTVPGIFSRDTPFSHGNHEPGWVVAPGMQGMQVQPFTANMLTPESLAELLGGPDIAPPAAGNQLARTAECV